MNRKIIIIAVPMFAVMSTPFASYAADTALGQAHSAGKVSPMWTSMEYSVSKGFTYRFTGTIKTYKNSSVLDTLAITSSEEAC